MKRLKPIPELLHLADTVGRYHVDGDDLRHETNPLYRDGWDRVDGVTPQVARASRTSVGADRRLRDAGRPTRAVARASPGSTVLARPG